MRWIKECFENRDFEKLSKIRSKFELGWRELIFRSIVHFDKSGGDGSE